MGKTNGFSLPLHHNQILTWLISLWHTLIPLVLDQSSRSIQIIAFYILYYTLFLLTLYTGYKVTKSNPGICPRIDPQYLHTEDSLLYYCTVCRSYVEKNSKHCGQCNRCIDGFDHHCNWLNNCIGLKNYKVFIILLVIVLAKETVLVAFEGFFLQKLGGARYWVIFVDLIGNCLIFVILMYLLAFHLYLIKKNQSTYEFLKGRNKIISSNILVKMSEGQDTREKVHTKSKSEDKGIAFSDECQFDFNNAHSVSKEEAAFSNSQSVSLDYFIRSITS